MTRLTVCALLGLGCTAAWAQTGSKPVVSRNLEMAAVSVERTEGVGLSDCPPGANTVSSRTKPGEEFAVVTVQFKVLPGFKPAPMKRPVLTDTAGKTYNTAATFVDVGKVPEFSCGFPFRIPMGTPLASITIDGARLDVSSLSGTAR